MKERLNQLKNFNWRLFAALCALSLIPAIYQTIKTFIISSNNQSAIFDIIGQMEWFDLINETLQAFVVFTMDVIILMFGFGMIVHFAISLIEEKLFLRKFERKRVYLDSQKLLTE